MTKYRVWSKYDEEQEDAIEIDAWDEEDAAIEWGRIQDDQGNYDGDYIDLTVNVLAENKRLSVYTVYVEFVPEFHAYKGEVS